MIGEIKKETIGGKEYDIVKKGVNTALTVQSIFLELISKAGINEGKNMKDTDIERSMMIAMRGQILNDIKSIIVDCVAAPVMTGESYDKLDPSSVTQLFMSIYYHHTGKAEKKKD